MDEIKRGVCADRVSNHLCINIVFVFQNFLINLNTILNGIQEFSGILIAPTAGKLS
jgi:hypothetical protein